MPISSNQWRRLHEKKRLFKVPSFSEKYFTAPFNIAGLPDDILLLIVEHLFTKDLVALATTCRGYYSLLRPYTIKSDVQDTKPGSEGWSHRAGGSVMYACKTGDIHGLRIALDAGCSPLLDLTPRWIDEEFDDDEPWTIAMMCISHEEDRVDLLKELLIAGLDVHQHIDELNEKKIVGFRSLLHKARNPAMIAFLLALGLQKDIHTLSQPDIYPGSEVSPLASAVRAGASKEAIGVLLDAGADPSLALSPPMLKTPLYPFHDYQWACTNALDEALHRGDHEVAQLLLNRGAVLNPTDHFLPFIVGPESQDMVQWGMAEALHERLSVYIPLGLDINQQCPIFGQTRLHLACRDTCDAANVKTLLHWGADPALAIPHIRNHDPDEPVRAFQNLLLAKNSRFVVRTKQQIEKAQAILAAQNTDVPEAPEGYTSMLAWAVKAVPLMTLAYAVRTLGPWIHKMHIDESVAKGLRQRQHVHHRLDRKLRRKGRWIAAVEGELHDLGVPGFAKHQPWSRSDNRPRRVPIELIEDGTRE